MLSFTRDQLLANHSFAKPHMEAGYRLHGGFDDGDVYVSPRTLNRGPAIQAWGKALEARGFPLVDSSPQLMAGGSFPTVRQQQYLLDLGLGQTLWEALSITGVIEARGRRLAEANAPDFQSIIIEDITNTATGHLNKGLLEAHGLDEGGDPERGEGGHDSMWFAVRDMLFGRHAYPHAEVPESIARPELGRLMPQIPKDHEDWILLLMNVLMIEIRAENFFRFCTTLMRDPASFRDRRDVALHAAELVDRIRQDEAPHVGYLTVVVSELRSFTFKTADGGRIGGVEMIDPIWHGMVHWHAVSNREFERERARKHLIELIRQKPNGSNLVREFEDMEQRQAA